MTISIIIVDYGTLKKSIQYINHLDNHISSTELKINYIIVDNYQNYSLRNELENILNCSLQEKNVNISCRECWVSDINDYSIHFLQNVENGGYAKGNNLGVKYCEKYLPTDYYLFSNNDIIITESFDLYKLLDCFENNQMIAVVGPEVIGLDGRRQGPHIKQGWVKGIFLRYIPSRFINKICNDTYECNLKRQVYWTSGCFLLVDRDKFMQVGMFDENTFLYCEEMILAEKLDVYGNKYFYCDECQVIHEAGGTIQKKVSKIEMIENDINSRIYYFRTYRNVPNMIMNTLEYILRRILNKKRGYDANEKKITNSN